MANNETQFQIDLKDAFKEDGCHAMRMRHYSMGGVADLYVKKDIFPVMWIECKFVRGGGHKQITAQQNKFLNDARRAGAYGGWATCKKFEDREELWMGKDRDDRGELIQTRRRGEKWKTTEIYYKLQQIGY